MIKSDMKESLKDKFVGREGSMLVEKAELATVQNTKEIYPNLMAANGVAGLPRMGPIFGGNVPKRSKSGKISSYEAKWGVFKKNNIHDEIKEVIH